MDRCINCGDELGAGQPSCATCQAPALGARAEEKVEVALDEVPTVPPLCCCCLAPREEESPTKLHVGPKHHVLVQVPWCHNCKQRSSIVILFLLGGMLGLSAALVLGIRLIDAEAYGMMALALFVGLIGGAAAGLEAAKSMNRRGHVAKCTAVSSSRSDAFDRGGRRGGKLAFGNRAFAREWARLNPRR
jgi:hypothetical protein